MVLLGHFWRQKCVGCVPKNYSSLVSPHLLRTCAAETLAYHFVAREGKINRFRAKTDGILPALLVERQRFLAV